LISEQLEVSPRLTLESWLALDGIPHTYEANNRMSNFYQGLYDPRKRLYSRRTEYHPSHSPGLGPSPNPILNGYSFT